MSKASDYAKAMNVPPPAEPKGFYVLMDTPSYKGTLLRAGVTSNGGVKFESNTVEAEHVPALIKWLRETFED